MPDLIDKVELSTLSAPERGDARDLQAALHEGASLRTAAGKVIDIPDALGGLFETLARAAADGQSVSVRIGGGMLTARQAAEELGMSRTYLCRLMDEGAIAGTRVGTHRRIAIDEVERYRLQRADELAAKYVAATAGLPDVDDKLLPKLAGPAPRRS